jgi:non-ribosomal peptide synthetase component F
MGQRGTQARFTSASASRYGPTENTTFTTWYLIQEVPEEATTIPIGRPIANTQVYLLDKKVADPSYRCSRRTIHRW